MLPARIRKGAETGMWKVRYWDSWSRCRSDRIWKVVFGVEKRPDMRLILDLGGCNAVCKRTVEFELVKSGVTVYREAGSMQCCWCLDVPKLVFVTRF